MLYGSQKQPSWKLKWLFFQWCGVCILLFVSANLLAGEPVSWESGDGFRKSKLPLPKTGKIGFQKLNSRDLGILFTNQISVPRSILNRNLLNGSGVAVGDVDGDGWCDLYFCGLDSENALFRNLGNWKFSNITGSSAIACAGQDSTGAVFADVDGDSDLDLLVTALGQGVRLFTNNGKGEFSEATEQAGLKSKAGSMSMALADVDNDSDLDLYVANYRPDTIADMPTITFTVQTVKGKPTVARVNGQPVTSSKWTNRFEVSPSGNVIELGESHFFYLNDGKGRFTSVSFTGGTFLDEDGKPLTEEPRDWGLAVQMRDFTGDGRPDIYVCNDYFSPDRIWINDGNGQFRAIARTAIRTTSNFSMGVDFADFDRDGDFDFFVVDMLSPDHRMRHVQLGEGGAFRWPPGLIDNRPQAVRNTLQMNRGDGTFADVAHFAGVEASDWSWGPVFLDVDLDGFEDILITNGQMRDFQNVDMAERIERVKSGAALAQDQILELIGQFPTLETPNVAFRNKGDGRFEDVSAAWGFATPGISQGIALADLDNDGDMDVVMNNLRDVPGIYRNENIAPRVAVRLKGIGTNGSGVGAKVKLRGGSVEQVQEIICGGRYLSGDQLQRVFAANSANNMEVEVTWPSGRQSIVPVQANYLYEIEERRSAASHVQKTKTIEPFFEEIKNLPLMLHSEEPYDDVGRQPLLTKAMSQLGPGVTWHDLNGDGWEDLVEGGGRGGRLNVWQNTQGSGFIAFTNPPVNRTVARDQTTVLGILQTLLAGSSNYEDGTTNGGLIRIHDFQRGASGDSIIGHPFSCGPLAAADMDSDGDLDLFIGGRTIPGRYPEPADSLLLKNEGGRFTIAQRWEKLGLVSGAVFSDLDQDNTPELVLATEWGPVRVFKQIQSKFEERTRDWGLDVHTGWWNGIATGDFDGDGRMEIVASNWGLNSAYKTSRAHPRKIYFGDLDENSTVDIVEARFNKALEKEAPERTFNLFRGAMPFLQERVPSFQAFGNMSVQEIFGDALKKTAMFEARTFESTIFFFRNGKYEATPLPKEAQFTPAFGVCIADMDGDGAEDLFLSQNFFAVHPVDSRCDAGRGLWLKGDGRGGLRSLDAQESGVEVYGEQRGCAIGDFNADGRWDLAVSQNANALKLYRNVKAKPGLRVRLKGPEMNPAGVGALIRLKNGDIKSSVREIQAGSGYWSQNSAVQVMTLPNNVEPAEIWVRWPGGKAMTVSVPKDVKEVELRMDESIRALR